MRLRIPHPRLARLHPVQLAELVESASRSEGGEIIDAVGGNPELEADVFEQLEPFHQLEFLEDRPDVDVAALIARMEPDDAADLVGALPEERRESVLAALPAASNRRLRALLGYDPATAGGLMSPDFACVYEQATVFEALERVRTATISTDSLAWIFAMNSRKRLTGAIALADLVRSDPAALMAEVAPLPQRVRADADLEEVSRLMTDYDLTVVAVTDNEERLVGVVTADDVLELVLPKAWRRRFGLFGDD